jgi:hypothetical protein
MGFVVESWYDQTQQVASLVGQLKQPLVKQTCHRPKASYKGDRIHGLPITGTSIRFA